MRNFDLYETITNQVIERLENGVVPWQKPWNGSESVPRNLVSKKPYRGINFWMLLSDPFMSPYYLTWNQVNDLGGKVKKGSKSTMVVFWKLVELENADTGEVEKKPFLRYYRIFNLDQVDNIPESKIPKTEIVEHDFNPIDDCERLVEFWEDCPKVEHGGGAAYYTPAFDMVTMPDQRFFKTDEKYYSTLFHELVHSTGHRKRTNRHSVLKDHRFGSKDYSQEELVAELGAAYLCGMGGIVNATIDQSAAYIKSWIAKFKEDKKILVMAAAQAQKAVDYIFEKQKQPSVKLPESELETVEA